MLPTHVHDRRREQLHVRPGLPDRLSRRSATTPTQTVTYELNPKAKWLDGTQVSAADFIAQWKANNGTNKGFTVTATTGYDDITSVAQGASPQEVIVTFKDNYADWKGLFGPLYPAAMNATPDSFNTSWKAKPLDSAGPFMYQGSDAQSYTVVRNPNWWGRKPTARHDRLQGHLAGRADPGAPEPRDRLRRHRPGRREVRAGEDLRGRGHPRRRWSELPSHHDQRLQPGACRTRTCVRALPWASTGPRSRTRCSARWVSRRRR